MSDALMIEKLEELPEAHMKIWTIIFSPIMWLDRYVCHPGTSIYLQTFNPFGLIVWHISHTTMEQALVVYHNIL